MRLRIVVQSLSFALFMYFIWQTTFPLVDSIIAVDLFLRLDPLISSLAQIADRQWIERLSIGLILLVLTLFLGRIFCGFICPMGITLDISRKIDSKKQFENIAIPKFLWQVKYLVLVAFIFSAFIGVNYYFWGSPIALITRFYTLVIHPILLVIANFGIEVSNPILERQGINWFSYTQIFPRVFNTIYFVAIFFVGLFVLERLVPRFWCRYICPAGALLAFFSLRPVWRRRVHKCVNCGKCIKACPSSAIKKDARLAIHSECITCQTCVDVCPVGGIRFACKEKEEKKAIDKIEIKIPSRRAFLYAAASGSGLATLAYVNAASLIPQMAKLSSSQLGFIRPPAARPENEFLARCVRCGQCMKACPTNGLQPAWLIAGFEGIFSPILQSRIGGCEPECNVCGQVCPTQAIMALDLNDKMQAKIGTAVVYPELCLAFAQGRACVVCQEVCPYGAIHVMPSEDSQVPVPKVDSNRCYGCGFCEKHCPVNVPAVVVQPLNTLRLNENEYAKVAEEAGLDIRLVSMRQNEYIEPVIIPEGQLPPGFSN